jgi:quercetin dioxygenase-like cupin family protein
MRFVVLQPGEGESYWQPEPANGFVSVKASPAILPGIGFSQGIQVVPPGAHVREHAHLEEDEVIFCLSGEGRAEIEAQSFRMSPGTVIAIARGTRHSFHNESGEALQFVWTICRPGLETYFQAVGKPKTGETPPPAFARPTGPEIDRDCGIQAGDAVPTVR